MTHGHFWLVGNWIDGWVPAVKTALLWLAALAGLRLGSRRVLAPLSAFDVLTLAALGSVVGRTATAHDTSFVEGVAALIGLLGIHRAVVFLRRHRGLARVLGHRPRVLVAHGRVDHRALRRCGLTADELADLLRERGVADPGGVRYLVYEAKGQFTIVADEPTPAAEPTLTPIRVPADRRLRSRSDVILD